MSVCFLPYFGLVLFKIYLQNNCIKFQYCSSNIQLETGLRVGGGVLLPKTLGGGGLPASRNPYPI